MELINTVLAVTVLWLAGGIIAALIVGFFLLIIWWSVIGTWRLFRRSPDK